jgi:hypothetical protein
MVQTIAQPSSMFHVTLSMLHMDKIMEKTPLKDLAQLQLVLSQIPSKELYKLQVSITWEVYSRARTDTVESQQVKDNWDEMELVFK